LYPRLLVPCTRFLYLVPSFIKYLVPSFILYLVPSFILYLVPSFILYLVPSFILYLVPLFILYLVPSFILYLVPRLFMYLVPSFILYLVPLFILYLVPSFILYLVPSFILYLAAVRPACYAAGLGGHASGITTLLVSTVRPFLPSPVRFPQVLSLPASSACVLGYAATRDYNTPRTAEPHQRFTPFPEVRGLPQISTA